MNRICVGAYTAPSGDYPPYLSVNQEGATVSFTVRGPKSEGHEGPCATVSMPLHEFHKLLAEMNERWRQVPAQVDAVPKTGA
jgi:hypothetical protein